MARFSSTEIEGMRTGSSCMRRSRLDHMQIGAGLDPGHVVLKSLPAALPTSLNCSYALWEQRWYSLLLVLGLTCVVEKRGSTSSTIRSISRRWFRRRIVDKASIDCRVNNYL